MKIVLYTEITFANKTVKEYLQYITNDRVVTVQNPESAKKFKSYYEAKEYVKNSTTKFNVEEL